MLSFQSRFSIIEILTLVAIAITIAINIYITKLRYGGKAASVHDTEEEQKKSIERLSRVNNLSNNLTYYYIAIGVFAVMVIIHQIYLSL